MAAAGASLVTRLGVEGLPSYVGGMKAAGDEVDKFAKKSNQSLGGAAAGMKSFGSKMSRNVTLPIVAAGTASFVAFAGFDKTMRQFGANADVGGKSLKGFTNLALKMGKETSFSAREAAQAMLELSKGGMSAAEIKANGLKETLTLAAAGSIELGAAAGYMANTLNMFGLKAKDAASVSAALAGGANASTASVESLGQGLSQVGAGAKDAGMGLNETVAALALLDQGGVKGSDAGTSLKTMLASLAPTAKKQKDAIKALGLEFTNSNGTFKSMAEVAEELKTKLEPLTEVQKKQALNTIFGSDASRAASIIMNGGAEAVNKYTAATKDMDAANKMAKTNTEGASGSIEQMVGSLETAGIQIGTAIAPSVIGLAGFVTDLANAFSSLPQGVQQGIVGVAAFAAVTGPTLSALGSMAQGLGAIRTGMAGISAASSGMSLAAVLTNPLVLAGLAAAGAGVALYAMSRNTKEVGVSAKDAAQHVRDLDSASKNLAADNLSQKESDLQLVIAKKQHSAALQNLNKLKRDGSATSAQITAAEEAEAQAALQVERATLGASEARKKNQKTLADTSKSTAQAITDISRETKVQADLKKRMDEIGPMADSKDIRVAAAFAGEMNKLNTQFQKSVEKSNAAKDALGRAKGEYKQLGPAAAGAADKIREINNLLSGLPKDVKIDVRLMYQEVNKPRPGRGTYAPAVPGYATGGLVPGRGPNKDTVVAALTKGEYVIDRNTVDKFGPDFFKGLQGYKKGGLIQTSLAQAGKRAAVAANPTLALAQAQKEHKAAVSAVSRISGSKAKDKKEKLAAAKDNVKQKADAVIAARKALADAKDAALVSKIDKSLAGQMALNAQGQLRANATSDLTDDIAATNSDIATNNQRIAGLQNSMKGAKGAARQQLQEQLNAAIEQQISLDTQRTSLITQQNDAIKQAALDAPKAQMVLRDAQTNYAMALAKATPGIEDDLAATSQALQDEEARRAKINAAMSAATTDEERANLVNQLADSVNATTSLTEQMKNVADANNDLAAQLERSKRAEAAANEAAKLNASMLTAFMSTNDIGKAGGANAWQAAQGAPMIQNNIYALSGADPAVQKALSDTSNSGNSFGGSADKLYNGRTAAAV